MFDEKGDAELLGVMAEAQRDERVAVARRLLAAGRLCQLRMADVDAEDRFQWCVDNWEAVAAEVGAELGISRRRASTQMNYGVELLERLPKLGAVFASGEVDFRVVAVAVFRTGLVTDEDVLTALDARLAAAAPRWNAYSNARIAELVDWWVREADPAAERNARSADADRNVTIGPSRDGLTEFWGTLRTPDAAALDRRLNQLTATVCRGDPRTRQQRRADAMAVLTAGGTSMVCGCESADCRKRGSVAAPGQIVIHVMAEAATVTGKSDAPGYLPGHGAIPADQVRILAERALLRPMRDAGEFQAEAQYRPSTALAEFVRNRDLCCRFPGCGKPAEVCDIDHTVPYGRGGPTHPSNLALLCRLHHLLKTFLCGEKGWREEQFTDGTIVWTSPSGRTYTTTPGGALFFPQLAEPSGPVTAAARGVESEGRTLMMPTRRRPRAAERAARIRWERGLNEARMNADPPPF